MNLLRPLPLLALSIALAAIVGGCAKKVSAKATVQVSRTAGAPPAASASTFTQTNIKVIESQNTLGRAVDSLGLAEKWGLDRAACIERVGKTLKIDPVRGTDLIEIRVFGENRPLAADIANAVAASYREILSESGNSTQVTIHEKAQ